MDSVITRAKKKKKKKRLGSLFEILSVSLTRIVETLAAFLNCGQCYKTVFRSEISMLEFLPNFYSPEKSYINDQMLKKLLNQLK